jgi:hypothetical protein
MRGATIHAPGDVRVAELPDDVAGPGQSLVRITSVGLCGSDIHWFGEGAIGDAVLARPLVLGHEMAGIVESGPLEGPLSACIIFTALLMSSTRVLSVSSRLSQLGSRPQRLINFLIWAANLP